MVTLPMTLSDP